MAYQYCHFSRGLDSAPTATQWLITTCSTSSKRFPTPFGPPQAPGLHMVHTSNTLIFSYPFFLGGVVGEKTGQKYARIKDACHNTCKSLKESKGAHQTPLPALWLTSSPPSSLLHLRCHFFMGPQQLPVFPLSSLLDYAPYLIMQASVFRSHQPQNHATNN